MLPGRANCAAAAARQPCQPIVGEKFLAFIRLPLAGWQEFCFFIAASVENVFPTGMFNQMQMSYTMRSSSSRSTHHRYSAKNMAKPVNFFCLAPEARAVSVVGDFNDWHPNVHPMRQLADGSWHLQIPLNHGHHHYAFLVDGTPVLDPRAMGMARNENNGRVSVIAVS
jgi:hypothetical protein